VNELAAVHNMITPTNEAASNVSTLGPNVSTVLTLRSHGGAHIMATIQPYFNASAETNAPVVHELTIEFAAPMGGYATAINVRILYL